MVTGATWIGRSCITVTENLNQQPYPSDTPLIDTNVFCYLFDAREPRKSAISRALLARCFRLECRYSVSVQNLAEFSVVMTEKITTPAPYALIRQFISDIARFDGWKILQYGVDSVLAAQDLQADYSLHFWDALLAATMKEHRIDTIYSEDDHFKKIPWLKTINPYIVRKGSE